MKFLDRKEEISRLTNLLNGQDARLVIVYGRRRCGKSTLLKKVLKPSDIYFMAQQADETIQRSQLARSIAEKIKGFDAVVYPDWESLFNQLNSALSETLTLCIDEFPYLVKSNPGLPSLLQKYADLGNKRKYHLILCGSSQQMMRNMILGRDSALYGRAHQILNVLPLKPGWITEGLDCSPEQAVAEFAVWGGVPRYWELREGEGSFEESVKDLILDRLGVLHEEPARLFLDDMREYVQAYSILTVVGLGSHRLSEIAGRLGKPSTQLTRPVNTLIELGYLKREIPFGVSMQKRKRSLYKISDPFMNFYYTFLAPNLSRLELGLTDLVFKQISGKFNQYVSREWENLCRWSVPFGKIDGMEFDQAFRWWGTNINGDQMELDIVAESVDKNFILVGECKWGTCKTPEPLLIDLEKKADLLPGIQNRAIIPVLFVKEIKNNFRHPRVLLPKNVLERLK